MSRKSASADGGFGPLETEVMNAVWAAGTAVSVRVIVEALNGSRGEPLAYTTVMTVMNRLADKRALARSPAGRSFLYEATAPDPAGIAVKNVIRTYGDEAMAHFVDEARADPEVWRRMQRMMSEDLSDRNVRNGCGRMGYSQAARQTCRADSARRKPCDLHVDGRQKPAR
jgi:predicted transcriptional regulator